MPNVMGELPFFYSRILHDAMQFDALIALVLTVQRIHLAINDRMSPTILQHVGLATTEKATDLVTSPINGCCCLSLVIHFSVVSLITDAHDSSFSRPLLRNEEGNEGDALDLKQSGDVPKPWNMKCRFLHMQSLCLLICPCSHDASVLSPRECMILSIKPMRWQSYRC